MFLIALSGGDAEEREKVAGCLVSCGKVKLASYSMYPPLTRTGKATARRFRDVDGEARARTLGMTLEGLEESMPLDSGLVVTHCLTPEEAKLVRELGGEVWHLYATVVSADVPIQREDRMINPHGPTYQHALAPVEALSEYMLAAGLATRARRHV